MYYAMHFQALPAAAVLSLLFLLSCGREGPLPPADKTPPRVSATAPANGSTNVPVELNNGIVVTFSEKMNRSTISTQTIALKEGQNSVPGAVTYAESSGVATAVFAPSVDLKPATLYRLDVAAAVKDLYGNPMEAPYISSFSTGTVPDAAPPAVLSTVPAQGDTAVVTTSDLAVTFSEPLVPSTIVFTLSTGSATVPCGMSYSGATAIFTPFTVLEFDTLYTAKIYAGAADPAGNVMQSAYTWSFTTAAAPPDTLAPVVTGAVPLSGSTNVAVNLSPSVSFSEPMAPATIVFTLSAGTTVVPGSTSTSGATAIFTPAAVLAFNTLYAAKVSAGAEDLSGNTLQHDYGWSFRTANAPSDTLAPVVTAAAPANGSTNVAANLSPSVSFSEPMDPATILFTLSTASATVSCRMSYSGTTAVFTPSTVLAFGTLYTAKVSAGAEDLAGNRLEQDYAWSFTTAQAPQDTTPPGVTGTAPAEGATEVAVNLSPSVSFSEPMVPATIVFTLTTGSAAVPCGVSYSGTTAICTPFTVLEYDTLYTAKVSAGATDLAQNPMQNDYVWSFTTAAEGLDIVPPAVAEVVPAIGAVGIDNEPVITITFTEEVDPVTISFILTAGTGTADCPMTCSGVIATCTPSRELRKNTLYTAWLKNGVKDLAGNAMPSDYFWSFKTK